MHLTKAVLESLDSVETAPSNIPGHPFVSDQNPLIDDFIAFVADMRDSSKHLLQAISKRQTKVSQLQRVYFETSALLPAIAKTVSYEEGAVTEYLGDGLLALFQVAPGNISEALYAARRAAINSIEDTRELVNSELETRYNLDPLNIGIGLAYSRAIVTLVGLPGEKHPKAIGECIYRAAKLSCGTNEIMTDDYIKESWPSATGGTVIFKNRNARGVNGYILTTSK